MLRMGGSGALSLKRILSLALFAFALNIAWEFGHSILYNNYRGGAITYPILIRAAVVDTLIISTLYSVSVILNWNKKLFIIVGGILVAVAIEKWALGTDRWEYNSLMPIIPVINIGLSPAIQLSVTGLLALLLGQERRAR